MKEIKNETIIPTITERDDISSLRTDLSQAIRDRAQALSRIATIRNISGALSLTCVALTIALYFYFGQSKPPAIACVFAIFFAFWYLNLSNYIEPDR